MADAGGFPAGEYATASSHIRRDARALAHSIRELVGIPLAWVAERSVWTTKYERLTLREFLNIPPNRGADATVRLIGWRNTPVTVAVLRWKPRKGGTRAPRVMVRPRPRSAQEWPNFDIREDCGTCRGEGSLVTMWGFSGDCPKCHGEGFLWADGPAAGAARMLGRAALDIALATTDEKRSDARDRLADLIAEASENRDAFLAGR